MAVSCAEVRGSSFPFADGVGMAGKPNTVATGREAVIGVGKRASRNEKRERRRIS